MLQILNSLKEKINRREKYFILTAFLVLGLFGFAYFEGIKSLISAVLAVFVSTLGFLYVQYTSVITKDSKRVQFIIDTFLGVVALPGILVLGALLSLHYFPNLSLITKSLAILGVGFFMYIILLVINIFLVVYEKGEVFPLFRVASTWSQILVVVVSIPFFAGVFKLPFISFIQVLITIVTAFIFALFMTWVQDMDPEIPPIDRVEKVQTSLFVAFMVGALGLSVSFIPTESFLRALLMASSMMFSLGYIQAHYKNIITKRLIFEYSLITIVFLILVLIFNQI